MTAMALAGFLGGVVPVIMGILIARSGGGENHKKSAILPDEE